MPRHLGGTNDSDNLVEVSVEEHARIHHSQWILGGRWQDELAWRTLSGRIDREEAVRLAGIYANTGKKCSTEKRKKISETLRSKPFTPKSVSHKCRLIGNNRTEKQKIGDRIKSLRMIGGSSWNAGLSKENDKRLAIAAIKMSKVRKGRPSPRKGRTFGPNCRTRTANL